MAPAAAPSRKRKRRNLMQGFSSSMTPDGRRVVSRKILNAKGIENARNEEHRQMLERVKAMNPEQRAALQALRDDVAAIRGASSISADNDVHGVPASVSAQQALDGSVPMRISQAGVELRDIPQDHTKCRGPKAKREDPRTRRDRTDLRTDAFEQHMEDNTGA